MTARRSYGVLKKHQRKLMHQGCPYTYFGREDRCAICDRTHEEVDFSGDWGFHWNSGLGTVMVAETCSDAHALEFETFHRDQIEREWDIAVMIRQGRQLSDRIAGRRQIWAEQAVREVEDRS